MIGRIAALLVGVTLAGCAAPNGTVRHESACGSPPPPFHAPIACPSVDKNTRTLETRDEAVYGFTIERTADKQDGLRIPPQIVTPFVRPSHEELE